MWRWSPSRTVVVGAAAGIFAVCCLLPVGSLIWTNLGLTEESTSYLFARRQRRLLLDTAALGAGAAVLATAIGAPLGFVLARVALRGKPLLRIALAAPVLVPPQVAALSWVVLGNPRGLVVRLTGRDLLSDWTYSLPGAILVLGFVFYPLSMLAAEVAMRRVEGQLEEAALLVAPPLQVLRRITIPLGAPGILAAALVIFVLAVSELGVPGLLQVRVYTTEVFTAFAALYDFRRALLLALPLLLLCLMAAAVATRCVGAAFVITRRGGGVGPLRFDAWRTTAAAFAAIVLLAALVLPLAVLAGEAARAESVPAVIAGSGKTIVRSLALAASGATAVVAVAVWLGYARARSGRRAGRFTDAFLVVLFAVPSTIVGVGLIGLWNRPGPIGAVYGTDLMFLLGYLARLLPVATLGLAASLRSVPVSHEEAAAVAGARWLRSMWRIVLPQARFSLLASWVIAFILAFGDLGVSILVAPPGDGTLPVRMYTLIANAPPSHVAALALLQALVALAPLLVLAAAPSVRAAR
jgi:iron(III) transport system permease protein